MKRNHMRSIAIYVLIGGLLLGAVVIGMRFAKMRSNHYASNTPTIAVQQDSNNDVVIDEQSESPSQGEQPSSSAPVDTATNTHEPASQPITMPSTGAGDVVVSVIGSAAVSFSAITYVLSKRRLFSVATQYKSAIQ